MAPDEEHAAFHAKALQAGLQSPEEYLEVRPATIYGAMIHSLMTAGD